MQKKLIALAITAAFASAPAFADTSVYGLLDTGFGSVTNTPTAAGGASGTKTGESGIAFSQNQTSRVGIKSSEDLNGGMKITYQLEMGLSSNPQSNANFGKGAIDPTKTGFSPNASIGPDRIMALDLNLGEGTDLIAGKVGSPLRSIVYGNDAMYGANLIGNLVTMDSSLTARAVALAAVHNFGAVTGSLALLDNTQTKDGTPDVKGGNGFEATAVYKQDALSVSGGYRSTEATSNTTTGTPIVTASDATTKDFILAANYDFGVAKLYGQYAEVKVDESVAAATTTAGKKDYITAGVNVPFTSALAGYVQLSSGKDKTAPNGSSDSRNMSAYAVGAKYDLSKTTWAYADVGSAKLDSSVNQAGSKVDQIAIGLLHSF